MQSGKVATLWVNELDIRHAVRECRIGPFTFNDREDPKRVVYIIQAEKWPPPSCYFVYHGTSAHAAHAIERSKRFQVPEDFFVSRRRSSDSLPMLGPKWVYTSRSYLKARRFAYMDSRHPSSATVYSVGAVVRALVPIPFPPQTKLYVVGKLPAACDCRQRPECRDGLNFRADHIGTTADMYLNPQGIRQVWVDTAYTDRSQTFPEYLITPEDMYVSDMWYIPNPPASDLRDVQTFWPISVSPVTFI
jgi:hypothetical protein